MVASNVEIVHPIPITSPKIANGTHRQNVEMESTENTGQDDNDSNNRQSNTINK